MNRMNEHSFAVICPSPKIRRAACGKLRRILGTVDDSCAETMASAGSGLAVALQTANMELGQEPKVANITAGAIAAASARPCAGAATKRQRHVGLTGNE